MSAVFGKSMVKLPAWIPDKHLGKANGQAEEQDYSVCMDGGVTCSQLVVLIHSLHFEHAFVKFVWLLLCHWLLFLLLCIVDKHRPPVSQAEQVLEDGFQLGNSLPGHLFGIVFLAFLFR